MRACLAVILAALATTGAAAQPTFRAHTEVVRIDVLVERDGRPVTGLVATDFIVEDNGVRQKISLLPHADAVTITTVLDVSGSMTPEKLTNAVAGLRGIMTALHRGDRHLLYAFAAETRRISLPPSLEPVTAAAVAGALRDAGGGHTSLFDALFAAVVLSDAGPGRKALAVLTDGRNNTSWLSAQAVIDAAIRHETVIYAVSVAAHSPHRAFDVPPMVEDDGLRLLQALADRTGGRVINAGWTNNLASVFDSLIREYRQRYILSFVPSGVATGDGWHRLNVRLRSRSGTVRARDGYWSR